jgi:predicted RNA-binding protein with PUA-like domain
MAYWLVKSEPAVYGWDQLVKEKLTVWDGVRNYAARNNLRLMKKGEQVFFYHSTGGTAIIGIAKVSKEAYQDPTSPDPAWVAVELKPFKKLEKQVSLEQVKADKRLSQMDLVRLGRLSVQTVKKEEWDIVMDMAGEK